MRRVVLFCLAARSIFGFGLLCLLGLSFFVVLVLCLVFFIFVKPCRLPLNCGNVSSFCWVKWDGVELFFFCVAVFLFLVV